MVFCTQYQQERLASAARIRRPRRRAHGQDHPQHHLDGDRTLQHAREDRRRSGIDGPVGSRPGTYWSPTAIMGGPKASNTHSGAMLYYPPLKASQPKGMLRLRDFFAERCSSVVAVVSGNRVDRRWQRQLTATDSLASASVHEADLRLQYAAADWIPSRRMANTALAGCAGNSAMDCRTAGIIMRSGTTNP